MRRPDGQWRLVVAPNERRINSANGNSDYGINDGSRGSSKNKVSENAAVGKVLTPKPAVPKSDGLHGEFVLSVVRISTL